MDLQAFYNNAHHVSHYFKTVLDDMIPETASAVDIRKRHMARVQFRATRIT